MDYNDMEPFVKNNPEAYRRFKAARCRKKIKLIADRVYCVWHPISNVILWICAVGGFVLSLIQLLQNQ